MLIIMPMYNYCNNATDDIYFYYLNDHIDIVRLQPVMFSFYHLCHVAVLLYLTYYAQYYAHEKTCGYFILYQDDMITIS